MHYTAYSLLTYDNMDSRQTMMIWTDVGEQTMDDDDDGGMVVSMPWDQISKLVEAPSKLAVASYLLVI